MQLKYAKTYAENIKICKICKNYAKYAISIQERIKIIARLVFLIRSYIY